MIPIKASPLADYFDEFSDEELFGTNLLTEQEAGEMWKRYFYANDRSLYRLPDDCWVARGPWAAIGSWIDAYNAKNGNEGVANLIAAATDWPDDEPLLLVQGAKQIAAVDFKGFRRFWCDFLAAFDDGPILISRRSQQVDSALRFVPVGQILLFRRV